MQSSSNASIAAEDARGEGSSRLPGLKLHAENHESRDLTTESHRLVTRIQTVQYRLTSLILVTFNALEKASMQEKPQVALPCAKYCFKLKSDSRLHIKIRCFCVVFKPPLFSHYIYDCFQQKQTAPLKIHFPGERKIEMSATGLNWKGICRPVSPLKFWDVSSLNTMDKDD